MIAVRLMGGLGNQMFQYALGRRMSLDHDTDLVIDLSRLENQPEGEVPRELELNCFNIAGKYMHSPVRTGSGLLNKLKGEYRLVEEKKLGYDPSILKAPNNTLFGGYWQTEKYFKKIEKTIRSDFTFIPPFSKSKKPVAEEIKASEGSIALQIRRGDYVTHAASSKFHGVMPLDYYYKAIKLIVKKVDNPRIFVISDDPGWCKKNLKLDHPIIFVDHIPGTGQEDMHLMSLCKHQIIANSSYGWWGAWLNSNRSKIVIAPKKWFMATPSDISDRLPRSWIKI